MKFGFVTCVQFGLSCIKDIYEIGGSLDIIITLHDTKYTKKSGRIYLDEFCKLNKVDLLKINSINNEEAITAIKAYELDWLFIIGWGWIANKNILEAPRKGCIGWHPSALPIGRGRASIPWAILKELNETAVTLFKLDEGIDTGDIVKQLKVTVDPNETATTLSQKVMDINKRLIQETWEELNSGSITLTRQDDSKATFWPGRTPEDGQLFYPMHIYDAAKLVRATSRPFPGAFIVNNNFKLIIYEAQVIAEEAYIGPYLKFADGFLAILDFKMEIL